MRPRRASARDGFDDPLKKDWSIHSFGAHFAEVTWEPATASLRVSRVVTVIDAGKILNPRAGRNQIEGAVVMGVGMALFEHTIYDQRTGAPVNSNFADYVIASHADTPKLDFTFLDHPDTIASLKLRARESWNMSMARSLFFVSLTLRAAHGLDRGDDVLIRAAAAQVAAHGFTHFGVARADGFIQQGDRRHQLSGRT